MLKTCIYCQLPFNTLQCGRPREVCFSPDCKERQRKARAATDVERRRTHADRSREHSAHVDALLRLATWKRRCREIAAGAREFTVDNVWRQVNGGAAFIGPRQRS